MSRAAAAISLVVLTIGLLVPSANASPTTRSFPPPSGCVDGTAPLPQLGLEPNQLQALYGFTPLARAGHRGAGVRLAVLEAGQSLDPSLLAAFTGCWGAATAPVEHVVPGQAKPPPGTEAQLDVQVVSALAPEVERLDVFETEDNDFPQFALLMDAALQPDATGGRLVDIISLSYTRCEAHWPIDARRALERQLERAAKLGVTVFVSGGDAGSTDCAQHPVVPGSPGTDQLAVAYPASSPWVVAVGGTQLDLDGTIETGGTVTDEVVWNEPSVKVPGALDAGGGGVSTLFSRPAWQQGLPGSGSGAGATKPDIAALAGTPNYAEGGEGTSGAAPLSASGWAVVLSSLRGRGIAPPPFLPPVLYELHASHPDVFLDVVTGTNDLFSLGCCDARPGYDLASGLGIVQFDRLAAALSAPVPTPPVVVTPTFTG